jgi:hypothetical protein
MKKLNKEEARTILSTLKRSELRDHAFGDREIFWEDADGKVVAEGYVGEGTPCVGTTDKDEDFAYDFKFSFIDRDALDLVKCGTRGVIERNDSTGPDRYQDGKCMPGLTLEGVRKELTKP